MLNLSLEEWWVNGGYNLQYETSKQNPKQNPLWIVFLGTALGVQPNKSMGSGSA